MCAFWGEVSDCQGSPHPPPPTPMKGHHRSTHCPSVPQVKTARTGATRGGQLLWSGTHADNRRCRGRKRTSVVLSHTARFGVCRRLLCPAAFDQHRHGSQHVGTSEPARFFPCVRWEFAQLQAPGPRSHPQRSEMFHTSVQVQIKLFSIKLLMASQMWRHVWK